MAEPIKILFASSEVAPFAKTGGLADVAAALPRALAQLGADVRVIMPRYKSIDETDASLRLLLPEVKAQLHDKIFFGAIQESGFPDAASVPVYFVENDFFFRRNHLYTENGRDYPDNPLRFAFFSMAALWTCKSLGWRPDVIHCNDWQTALIPTYVHNLPSITMDRFFNDIKVVYTIHNLGYQGLFDIEWMNRLSIPWEIFNTEGIEYYHRINLMKAGLVYSDQITTVSRTYAKEIQTSEQGSGLDGVLRSRADDLLGILNGIDENEWDPRTDEHIPANYSAADLSGKAECKAALQREFGLPVNPSAPVIAMVSRIAAQKGFDLVTAYIGEALKDSNAQLVVIGTGNPEYENRLRELADENPKTVSARITFNNALAHLAEAGADMFLMPSYYEPCGLNQMYSMRYGTVPVVRKTGGLADTVTNASPSAIRSGRATGFVFKDYDGRAMVKALQKAIELYRNKPDAWAKLVSNGMKQDFSWHQSAMKYLRLYTKLKK